ncbi:SGNH/GDSL hydrolase family protein [bacterium]|nr:SGNH/GDSL hydrolase family protein [bacterium]
MTRRRLPIGVRVAFAFVVVFAGAAVAAQIQYAFFTHWLDGVLANARSGRFAETESRKILFMGDSFTEGRHAESHVGYWAYLPDRAKRTGYETPVETVNIAVAGSTTLSQIRQLESFLDESKQTPDDIMIISSVNNPDSVEFHRAYLGSNAGAGAPAWLRLAYRLPRAWIFSINMLGRIPIWSNPERADCFFGCQNFVIEALDISRTAEPYLDFIVAETGRLLGRIADIARARGIRLLAGTYIGENSVDTAAAAEALGISYLVLNDPATVQWFRERGYFLADGWHLNDAGQKQLAAIFLDWHRRLGAPGEPATFVALPPFLAP